MPEHWFDSKYRNGERPTLKDRFDLFSELEINLPRRTQDQIEKKLREVLFDIEREYTSKKHIIAYELLSCLGGISHLPRERFLVYEKMYKEVLKRHNNLISF